MADGSPPPALAGASKPSRKRLADAIRVLAMDAVEQANSGHPGMPMGMADAATALWATALKFDASDPAWPDRDRFVLSAGHGSMLLYALLHLTGSSHVPLSEIRNFRQHGSKTPGHPEYGHTPGVETTTGPLGQGLAAAVGMAMAERRLNARFGDDLVDHRTWVIAGDGCLMEGISQEAIALAGRFKLNRLTVLWDDNAISIDGPVSLTETTDQLARFKAAGWAVRKVDGHDGAAVAAALKWAQRQSKPSMIACRTRIGFGAPTKEGSEKSHGSALGASEVAGARVAYGWEHEAFQVPPDVARAWTAIGRRGRRTRKAWETRLAASPHREAFEAAMSGDLPAESRSALATLIASLTSGEQKAAATRASSGRVLEAIVPLTPELTGGSADLTGSVNTLVKGMADFDVPDYAGTYLRWGVREHAMAAAMNGMALHGGLIPYAGTFLVFSDYMRPAIRMAALQGIRVIHVGTHDSIGVGEDGPTHQPVEHLASLRAMPNVNVFRPADAVEVAECWALALDDRTRPSILALSRQTTPAVRLHAGAENLCGRGAYVLADAADFKATIFATGTEVALALKARDLLAKDGVAARVVSVPSFERFAAQPADYQASVIGRGRPRVAIEAGVRQGWDRFIGEDGGFVGMTGFGASAPAEVLFKAFGITAETVVDEVRARL